MAFTILEERAVCPEDPEGRISNAPNFQHAAGRSRRHRALHQHLLPCEPEAIRLMGDNLLSPARIVLLQDKRHAEHGGRSHCEQPECVDVRQSRSLQL